jgi:HK97 family phage major capsid protein
MDNVIELAEELVGRLDRLSLAERQREKPAMWERANALFDAAQADNRPMSEREQALYDTLTGAIENISRAEQQELTHRRNASRMGDLRRGDAPPPGGAGENRAAPQETEEYRSAFEAYVRYGMNELEPEQRRLLRTGFSELTAGERRALGTTSGAAGGFTVPTTFAQRLTETMEQFIVFDSLAEVLTTDSGEDIVWPGIDDTDNEASTVAEHGDVGTATDLEFTQNRLQAFMQTTGVQKVSIQLLQDGGISIDDLIGRMMGRRFGRRLATLFTTGSGVGQPQGAVTGSGLGKSFASATAITYNELIDLEHSIDPAYRDASRCRYMFADGTLGALRKLADSQNRPLWVPWLGQGVAGAVPATFNGWNYTVNNKMPAMTTGLKSVLFGDFEEAFKIRKVGAPVLVRLEELYAANLQVGFLMYQLVDSRVVETAALKHGIQA